MPKLVRIGGDELIKILEGQGFVVIRQKSSHVRLMLNRDDKKYFVTVPLHDELDRGTLRGILRSVEKCITQEILKEKFYK